MMHFKKIVSTIAVTATAATAFSLAAPVASADTSDSGSKTITSSRSFPKVNVARKDLLKESVSTDSDENSTWGTLEDLNVPQTKSQAEKDAEAAAAAAAQAEAERQAAAQAAAAAAAQAQSQTASRSASRQSLSSTSSSTASSSSTAVVAPSSSNGSGIVSYASQFQGVPYVYGGTSPAGFDCSGFVQFVYAQFGLSLPRVDASQRTWAQANGTRVSNPEPGDFMWYPGHVGIYVGNGLMIHAPRPGKSVEIVPVYTSFEYYRII